MSPDPNQEVDLKPGMFVEIKKSGIYQGDVGVVDKVILDSKKVNVKLIPRLGAFKKDDKNNKIRPPQKLF